jgi:uncharacterized protein DUF5994
MASAPHLSTVSLEERPRLRMKPDTPPSGVVDGAWWPRSRDLADQLPALLIELWDRLGGVERVSYNLTAWPGAPRRISVDGRLVRLGGYRTQDPLSIDLVVLPVVRRCLLGPGGGVDEVEPAGAVEGFFGAAGGAAAGQDAVFVSVAAGQIGPPREFRTAAMGATYAATWEFRYSSWVSLGVR